MQGFNAFVNYCVILFLFIIAACFILLLFTRILVYRREKKNNKQRKKIRNLLEQYKQNGAENIDISSIKTKLGIRVMVQMLGEEGTEYCDDIQRLISEAAVGFDIYLKRQLDSNDMSHSALVIKLIGELRIPGFNMQIGQFLYDNKSNADIQYVCYMALSLLGATEALAPLCLDESFEQLLSFRSFREIFKSFNGNKPQLCGMLINAADNYIKRVAIIMIGENKLTGFSNELMKFINSDDINLAIEAIKALSMTSYDNAAPYIVKLLDHERWEIRSTAVKALSNMGIELYAYAIANKLHDSEWWVRYNAATALAEYSNIHEVLYSVTNSGDRFATEILRYALQRKALKAGGRGA